MDLGTPDAGKRILTRSYIAAWAVAVFAGVALALVARHGTAGGPSAAMLTAYFAGAGASLVMFVMWLAVLVRLGGQHAWGWFVAVLVSQLALLGIIGIAAYAIAGPELRHEVVIRPAVT